MAITVHTLAQPWLWAEATSGGSLPASTTFYFIGFFSMDPATGPYYGNVPGKASDEISVTTTVSNKTIKMECYEDGGYVSAYANAGGGLVTVTTTTAHGRANSSTVFLRGTANYTGVYTISNVTTYTFDITATWVTDDGASKWFANPGMPDKPSAFNGYLGLRLKWDYYTMLRGDGSKIQWLNTNDPSFAAGEWDDATWGTHGHRRWNSSYFSAYGRRESTLTTGAGGEKYWNITSVVTTSTSYTGDTASIYEALNTSSPYKGTQNQTEITLRKYNDNAETKMYFQLPDGMSETESAVLILIDDTDTKNNWYYVISAIDAAGLRGKSIVYSNHVAQTGALNSDSYYQRTNITIRGCICGKTATFTSDNQPIWYAKDITLLGGTILHSGGTYSLKFDSCTINILPINSSLWHQPIVNLLNSKYLTASSAFVFDGLLNVVNTTFFSVTSNARGSAYGPKTGYTFSGAPYLTGNYVNIIRYFVNGNYISDFNFYRCAMGPTYTSETTGITLTYKNIKFEQIESDATTSTTNLNYDIQYEASYVTGSPVANIVINCYNVTSNERSNKLVRIAFEKHGTAGASRFGAGSIINHNFFFPVDLTVIDTAGNPIENATVTITNSGGDTYSLTTDSEGKITQTQVRAYTVDWDSANSDGYWFQSTSYPFYSKTTLMNVIDVTISKVGYLAYKIENHTLTAAVDWVCKLSSPSDGETTIIDSTLYDATIY